MAISPAWVWEHIIVTRTDIHSSSSSWKLYPPFEITLLRRLNARLNSVANILNDFFSYLCIECLETKEQVVHDLLTKFV